MALEEPNTATSVYRQYLKWKVITIKMGVTPVSEGYDLSYYEKLLWEHQIRWAPFQDQT